MKREVILVVARLLLLLNCHLAAAVESAACEPAAQRVYVWQRVWTPALCRSVEAHAREFSALDVFLAEISFQASRQVVYAEPNWSVLAKSACAVGLVIRVGSCRGGFADGSAETNLILAVCDRAIADAAKHGIQAAELQIDFDAATARLKDYAQLLRAVRHRLGSTRIVITVLPAWLSSPAFRELAEVADGLVLQVHSLTKPASFEQVFSLCDADQSIRWIRAAAAIGRPFRVALPTYGYRVAFATDGAFIGLQAEGPRRTWPAGTRLRELWAEPAEIVRIVNMTGQERPTKCEGLSWFRLPGDEDELAWCWPTMREVMLGKVPKAELKVTAERNREGAHDLMLRNEGTDRGKANAVYLHWSPAKLIASDMINGWRLTRKGEDTAMLQPPAGGEAVSIKPGEITSIGWLRFDSEVEIAVSASP